MVTILTVLVGYHQRNRDNRLTPRCEINPELKSPGLITSLMIVQPDSRVILLSLLGFNIQTHQSETSSPFW